VKNGIPCFLQLCGHQNAAAIGVRHANAINEEKVWLIGEKGVGMEYLKRPRSNALLRGPDCREKRPIQWLLAMFALSFSITLSSEKLAAFCRGG